MLALLGALGLALSPVNTTVKPVQATVLREEPEEEKTWKEKLQELMENQLINNIIQYVMSGSALTALVVMTAKYKGAKNKTIKEMCDEISNVSMEDFKKYVEKYYDGKIALLEKASKLTQDQMNMLIKCFILMQDRSAEGKAALLAYIDTVTKQTQDEEVKEVLEEQKEKVEEQIAKEDEVIEKIQEEEKPEPVE